MMNRNRAFKDVARVQRQREDRVLRLHRQGRRIAQPKAQAAKDRKRADQHRARAH